MSISNRFARFSGHNAPSSENKGSLPKEKKARSSNHAGAKVLGSSGRANQVAQGLKMVVKGSMQQAAQSLLARQATSYDSVDKHGDKALQGFQKRSDGMRLLQAGLRGTQVPKHTVSNMAARAHSKAEQKSTKAAEKARKKAASAARLDKYENYGA